VTRTFVWRLVLVLVLVLTVVSLGSSSSSASNREHHAQVEGVLRLSRDDAHGRRPSVALRDRAGLLTSPGAQRAGELRARLHPRRWRRCSDTYSVPPGSAVLRLSHGRHPAIRADPRPPRCRLALAHGRRAAGRVHGPLSTGGPVVGPESRVADRCPGTNTLASYGIVATINGPPAGLRAQIDALLATLRIARPAIASCPRSSRVSPVPGRLPRFDLTGVVPEQPAQPVAVAGKSAYVQSTNRRHRQAGEERQRSKDGHLLPDPDPGGARRCPVAMPVPDVDRVEQALQRRRTCHLTRQTGAVPAAGGRRGRAGATAEPTASKSAVRVVKHQQAPIAGDVFMRPRSRPSSMSDNRYLHEQVSDGPRGCQCSCD